ncbi:hypothetical protein [Falsiroseomonas sp.]|jgi:hypothetical protein|uniref:hypothetical protein n=1 Tax=Falsiroseomonas sp. TaxID=2870721 RepID=UPI00337308AD|nr:hypothetical protein [Falsiroseomonas sp.]
MTPTTLGPAAPPELVAASLLTSSTGAEVHLVARDGQRLRLAADEATARALAEALWRALDRTG